MTIEDLKDEGVLLPEREWGKHELSSTVPRVPLVIILAVATIGIVIALIGDGGPLSFVAIGAFIISLYALTWVLDRSVVSLRRRIARERRRSGTDEG